MSFFVAHECKQSLSRMGNLFEPLNKKIPWENFRSLLEKVHEKARKSKAEGKPIDVMMMFKVLVLQRLYKLADEQLGFRFATVYHSFAFRA